MYLIVFIVLIAASLVQANIGHHAVFSRITRQAMGGTFMLLTGTNILELCERNGYSSKESEKLQDIFTKTEVCLSEIPMYQVSKQEYIDKIVDCSREAIQKTKECLPNEHKYYPDVMLEHTKSSVSFLYDNKYLLTSPDVLKCLSSMAKPAVQKSYLACLHTSETFDGQHIPASKAEFCRKFLPAGKCLPKTLKTFCTQTPNVSKYIKDNIQSLNAPCEDLN